MSIVKPSCLLVLFTIVTFCPLLTNPTFHLDDPKHLWTHSYFEPLNFKNLKLIWSHPHEDAYTPLTHTFLGLVASISKKVSSVKPYDARLFHTSSLFIHLLSSCIVFLIFLKILKNSLFALLASLLFAIHPVQVETVNWVTGLRDLLSGFLMFFSFYLLIFYLENLQKKFWIISIFLFFLSLTAKSSSSPFPFLVFIFCFGYGKLDLRKSLWMTLPYVAVLLVILPYHIKLNLNVVEKGIFTPTLWQRPLIMLDSFSFYIRHILWPVHLSVDYGRTPQMALKSVTLMWFSLLPILLGLYCWKKKTLLLPYLFFLVLLIPTSGILSFIYQHRTTVADRYAYLAMFSAAWFVSLFFQNALFKKIFLGVLLLLGIKSFHQTLQWRTQLSLYQTSLKANPKSPLVLNNLASAYEEKKDFVNAEKYYLKACLISDDGKIWTNLGALYFEHKKWEGALYAFLQADRTIKNHKAIIYGNLSATFLKMGRIKEATLYYQKAKQAQQNT